jgi:hypothetical protein
MTAWKEHDNKQGPEHSSAKRMRFGVQDQRRAESVVGGVEHRKRLVELGLAQ